MPDPHQKSHSALKGVLYGLSAVAIWALYLSYTRLAVSTTLTPGDVLLLRFGVAGLIMLPWVLMNGAKTLGGVGWWRGLALAAAVGPLFIFTASAAFIYIPLAHGAVLQPSTAAMFSIAAAILILGERVTVSRIAGATVIICGITLIAAGSPTIVGPEAWKGYALSVVAGLCWAAFTTLLRRWEVSGVAASAAVSVISALCVVPVFLLFDTLQRLAELPVSTLVIQVVVQGALTGVLAIIAYGRAVAYLGASGAALFPALVPAVTLVLGIPVTREWPTPVEWTGALLASIGLSIAVGAFTGKGSDHIENT